jgi:hypothetical protein
MSSPRIKLFSQIGNFYNKIYEIGFQGKEDKKFTFFFLSGMLASLFFLITILSEVNPFSLLYPFDVYDFSLPTSDNREMMKVYLTDGKKNLFLTERKVYLKDKDLKQKVYTAIIEISEPPFYASADDLKKKDETISYKKLPNLHFAIKTLWLQDKKLIIDFRKSTLLTELDSIKVRIDKSQNPKEEENEKDIKARLAWELEQEEKEKKLLHVAKIELLNSAFLVLEKTLFENFPEFEEIIYRIDGVPSDLPDLEYKLSEVKKKNS